MSYEGKKVLVVGMAKSGIYGAKLLKKLGAETAIYDRRPAEDFAQNGAVIALLKTGVIDFLGKDADAAEAWAEALVLSPGVPVKQPFLERAMQNGKEVISEVELGYEMAKAEFVGIGGTNGKTTTTALTGEIFKNAGRKTYVLGNIGLPICEYAFATGDDPHFPPAGVCSAEHHGGSSGSLWQYGRLHLL